MQARAHTKNASMIIIVPCGLARHFSSSYILFTSHYAPKLTSSNLSFPCQVCVNSWIQILLTQITQYLPICPCIYFSVCISVYLSIYYLPATLSIYQPICLHLPPGLSIYLYLSILIPPTRHYIPKLFPFQKNYTEKTEIFENEPEYNLPRSNRWKRLRFMI